jgi:circadian clock protein KaiB
MSGNPPSPGRAPLVLSLFVTDSTPSSVLARAHLENWLRGSGSDTVRLEVIDVLERPDLAETERVLATPTLIRRHPLPRRKIVGDLSDWEAVALSLDLKDGVA